MGRRVRAVNRLRDCEATDSARRNKKSSSNREETAVFAFAIVGRDGSAANGFQSGSLSIRNRRNCNKTRNGGQF